MVMMETSDTIIEEVRQYVTAEFLLDEQPNGLQDSDLLFEGGIIDSAGAITLVMHLESRYGIEIRDEELFPENFATIQRIGAFIERKMRVAARASGGKLES